MLVYLAGLTLEGKPNVPHYDVPPMQIAVPQHEGVLAVVWMCYKIIPLALHALECILGCQVEKLITDLLSEFCFVSRERVLVQHLIHEVEITVEDRPNVFLHRVIPV